MSGQQNLLRRMPSWLSVWLVLVAGCGTLQLPAIDPSGERIFLPYPASTTLESPVSCLPGCRLPRPAFTEPPAIPACPPEQVVAPVPVVPTVPPSIPAAPLAAPVTGLAIGQDQLVLSPARIVAPVNSEVILLAGICGPDGYYVTSQPIEWSLAQESVGQIVDVGEAPTRGLHALSSHGPRKLSNDFALTRTSRAARLITRGTPSPNDDVWLRKGQAWISLTSASQGVSHVTAVATGAENWEKRRQVARVHWVDAQWELPAPAVVRAGGSHTLTTRVTRSSSGRPVTDWTVRYELAGGAPATFGTSGLTSVDQPTDADGRATVTITPARPDAGSTQVLVRILSPADGDAPVEIGQGWTTVTWSAPGLAVDASGPEVASLDATLVYRIEVRNSGDLAADDVRVTATIPPLVEFLNSDPPANPFGTQVQWQLGRISPGGAQSIEIRCRAKTAGTGRLIVRASSGNLTAEDVVPTLIEAAALDIRLLAPPATARVGERVTFNIQVANIGSRSLRNIVLRDTFDPGLEHSEGEPSPVEFPVGDLEPNKSVTKALSFIVRRAGRLCHTVEGFADGGYTASSQACVTAEQARLAIHLEVTGPARAVVGDTVQFDLRVTNTGDAPLTGIRLFNLPGSSFEATRANPDYISTDGGLLFEFDNLQAGDTELRQVECRCLSANPAAESRTEVTTAEGLADARVITTIIERPATPPPPPPASSGPTRTAPIPSGPPTGQLQIVVTDTRNPISVGEQTTYIIEVKNDNTVSVKNVVVAFTLPSGLRRPTVTTSPGRLQFHPMGDGQYELDAIAEMRPGGTQEIRVEVEATEPGLQTFRAQILTPEIREAPKQTRVFP